MPTLYLDIDGVLLTTKHTQAAPGVDAFVDFITQHFACYWLTTHCKGDSVPALRYLSRFLKPTTLEKLRAAVQPTNWDTLKTEAIDVAADFYWLDDSPFQSEIAYLEARGLAGRLIVVNLNRAEELATILQAHYQLHTCSITQLLFMNSLTSQLEAYKKRDNFPSEEWEERGLYPSDEDVRQGMNLAVAEFADFLINQVSNGTIALAELRSRIQVYFDEHDNDDFDTEEREYIVDVQCELVKLVGVDCSTLF